MQERSESTFFLREGCLPNIKITVSVLRDFFFSIKDNVKCLKEIKEPVYDVESQ